MRQGFEDETTKRYLVAVSEEREELVSNYEAMASGIASYEGMP
jgi:hypothetical protein